MEWNIICTTKKKKKKICTTNRRYYIGMGWYHNSADVGLCRHMVFWIPHICRYWSLPMRGHFGLRPRGNFSILYKRNTKMVLKNLQLQLWIHICISTNIHDWHALIYFHFLVLERQQILLVKVQNVLFLSNKWLSWVACSHLPVCKRNITPLSIP